MNRPNPTALFGFFVAVIVAMCGASLLKGGLYIGKHEGDTFHLLQIVLRIAEGQWPHLDFMSPIGWLAFAPIAWFVKLGYGAGNAFLLGQALVAVVLLPAVWWTANSRLRGPLAYLFGLFVLVLVTALVHGETERSVSVSMHYNRWAWAVSFIAIVLAVVPPIGRKRHGIDGVLIGLAMAALMLSKVTYFAAFAIPITVALLLRGSGRTLLVALLTGLLVVLAVTVSAGVEYWRAYVTDLLSVAVSEIRPYPSEPFGAVMAAPAYLTGSLSLIFGIILLRQGREAVGGLVLLLLAPGFFYVTYQNFANDPQWLLLLGVLLLAFLPDRDMKNGLGWNLRNSTRILAGFTLAIASSSFVNLAYSPFRHLAVDRDEYMQLLPESVRHDDLFTTKKRAALLVTSSPLDVEGTPLAAYKEISGQPDPTVFRGEELPFCELDLGLPVWFKEITRDLENSGLVTGKSIFAADLFSSHWLFGETLRPIPKGAPWYYGGLPGIQNADFLLVPMCPVIHEVRQFVLDDVTEAGLALREVRRTKLYVLYALRPV